jgi:hypothetical protein
MMITARMSESGPRILFLVAISALGLALAACSFPSAGCREEELVAPTNLHPADDSVIDALLPTLTWSYEGDCEPESFRLRLSSSIEFPEGITAEVGGDTTWWVPTAALEAGMSYSWSVTPISGSAEGPWEGGYFRTGPPCTSNEAADYAAPVLMNPANGAAVDLAYITFSDGTREPTVSFRFIWDDPASCLPTHGYHVEVATSSDFGPGSVIDEWRTTHHSSMFFFAPGIEWEQCARYFWRVSTVLPDSTDGPTSEIWSFVTPNAGGAACLEVHLPPHEFVPPVEVTPPPAGSSAIAGHVWHDECAVPYESTEVAPPGCVIMPDGGMEANGILDPHEVGIEGVTVHLAAGPCPAVGAPTDVTDVSGYYSFTSLVAGTYCISIDATDEDNISVLIPGNWTVPYRWYGPGPIETEVSLGEADIQRLNDFGWDHQFLPSPGAAPSTPTPLMGTAIQNANCRAGPGSLYDVLTSVLRGVTMPIAGRNQESTWYAVQAPGLLAHCWVWGQSLEFDGDPSLAPILAAPPLPSPTPTQVQACWVWNPQVQQNVCTSPCPQGAQPGGACTP